MPAKQVLVVEDDEDIQDLLEASLSRAGFRVTAVGTAEDGLKTARSRLPDVVVLDLMLPDMDGLDVCRALKEDSRTRGIPIVMLTARGEEADIVSGLELGADDYVTKPFSPRVLAARLKAVLRRKRVEAEGTEMIRVHGIVIDPVRREVRVRGSPVHLTYTEFEVLRFLARRPGWVFTRYQIVEGIRGEDVAVTDRSVDVQIVGLRRKLRSAGKYIETVRGVGYRFKE